MFQMSFSASRATRLLVAVGVAWLGLALSAQAAHATYGKVQIVKINQGGDANDSFTFDTRLTLDAERRRRSRSRAARRPARSASSATSTPEHGTECTSRWGNVYADRHRGAQAAATR